MLNKPKDQNGISPIGSKSLIDTVLLIAEIGQWNELYFSQKSCCIDNKPVEENE